VSLHKRKSKAKKAKIIKKGKRRISFGINHKRRVVVRRQFAVTSTSSRLWPEEEKALQDIHTGKTRMIDVSGEDFLKEIKSVLNEQPASTA
jgi:hypothetical protein